MFTSLLKKDILLMLKDLKFQIFSFLIIILFIIGTISFVIKYKSAQENYHLKIKQHQMKVDTYTDDMTKVLRNVIYYFAPPQIESIAMKKKGFPNALTTYTTIFEAKIYQKIEQSQNSFELNWLFIIGMIGSFSALLFSYNSISSEKELGSLRLLTINGVTRMQCLISKYLSVMIIFAISFGLGFLFSTAIIYLMLGSISTNLIIKLLLFILISILFISFFVLVGIRVSMSSNIRNNIVIALTLWLIFLIIIPNLANIMGSNLHKLKSSGFYNDKSKKKFNEIFRVWGKKPECQNEDGSNSVYGNGNLKNGFRAKAVFEGQEASAKIKEEERMEEIKQILLIEKLSMISPYSVLEKIGEIILDQGLYKYYREIEQFKHRFEKIKNTLINEDQKDKESLHLFYSWAYSDIWGEQNPFSRNPYPKPKDFILTNYKQDSITSKMHNIFKYLIILISFNLIMFVINSFKIQKFDIR